MNGLFTTDPIALRFLMNETIYHLQSENKLVESSLGVDTLVENVDLSPKDDSSIFPFWGSNDKKVLFLLRNDGFDYFSADAEDAFLKTLAALKLTIQDVVVVNLDTVKRSFEDIKEVLMPAVCIYCENGTESPGEAFNELFEKEGVATLHTYSFESMLTDNDKKRTFWNAIKMINVKND